MIVTWSNVVILKVLRLVKFRYNLKLESIGFADRLDAGYEKRKKSRTTSNLLFTKVEKFVEGTALWVNIKKFSLGHIYLYAY